MPRMPILLALILCGCSLSGNRDGLDLEAVKSLNMKNGFDLAVTQDSLVARYGRGERAPREEVLALRNNQWVRVAQYASPSNLIVRQWGLIDLMEGAPSHGEKILEMVNLLASEGAHGGRLWAEGYSYWLYTRQVLDPWTSAFAKEDAGIRVRAILDAVDSCFTVTAYTRNGILYPAPFGDVLDSALSEAGVFLHAARPVAAGSCAFLTVTSAPGGYDYQVAAGPIGVNTHVPADTQRVRVRDGVPMGFKFYAGYAKKYSGPLEEQADMLRPERVLSIARLRLRERFKD